MSSYYCSLIYTKNRNIFKEVIVVLNDIHHDYVTANTCLQKAYANTNSNITQALNIQIIT